jgi:DNA adenine methylase
MLTCDICNKVYKKLSYFDKHKINCNKKVDEKIKEIIKPIIKWVGGKTQILDKLISKFPVEMNNYHEIFLGGGSVLLALLSYQREGYIKINKNIYAYDLNEPLIYVYKNIQNSHDKLYEDIQKIINNFNSCKENDIINRNPVNIIEAKNNKENYYYWIRKLYNKLSILDKKSTIGSAMFIFLNKTCFRGLFRIGPNGFNVPYGHYKNPQIIDKDHLDKIHSLIQNVIFEHSDFSKSLNNIIDNDFVYLDPPYVPENTNSFISYTENGFNIDEHKKLFQILNSFHKYNKFMLSNSDVSLVRDNFSNKIYNIETIICKRSINSKNPESKTNEVLITNF